ncbi:MAG TPA: ABC transporter permease [Candidatus Dependentiae bacterium]|nr:ABC transporter permease [Candidatus Dependentiae bacterium]
MNKQSLRAAIAREIPFLFSLPALVWLIAFLCVPIVILGYLSVATSVYPFISLQKYVHMFDMVHVRIITRSLLLSFCTVATCLLCAYPIAYFIVIKSGRWKNLFLFFLMIPLWTNFLIQVYGWFFILERNGLINSLLLKIGIIKDPLYLSNNLFSIFVVMVYCYLPFMILPLYTILEKLNLQLLEASADLGASAWQTFTRITLPLSMPGIRTGVLLTYVLSFGEFAIPTLVGGGKYMMVGNLISYYFLVMRDISLGSAFTLVSGMVLLSITSFLYWYLGKWCLEDSSGADV